MREEAVVEVEVPVWGRLDWKSGWQQFADRLEPSTNAGCIDAIQSVNGEIKGVHASNCAERSAGPAEKLPADGRADWSAVVAKRVCDFDPQWALLVDWSAVPAFEALTRSMALLRGLQGGLSLPVAYLNFRVYALSQFQQGEEGEAERRFYERVEGEAIAIADVIAALSTRYRAVHCTPVTSLEQDTDSCDPESLSCSACITRSLELQHVNRAFCLSIAPPRCLWPPCRDAHFLATGLPASPRPSVLPFALLPPLREDMRLRALEQPGRRRARTRLHPVNEK